MKAGLCLGCGSRTCPGCAAERRGLARLSAALAAFDVTDELADAFVALDVTLVEALARAAMMRRES